MIPPNEALPFSATRFMLDHRYGPVTEQPLGLRRPDTAVDLRLVEQAIEEGHIYGLLPYGMGRPQGFSYSDIIRQYNIDQALQGRRFTSVAPEGSASIPRVKWVPGRWGRWQLVPW
jgi:hypothetical protein